MATKLTKYEPTSKPGPESPYPWDEWLKPGTTWRLHEGEDFECLPSSIVQIIRRHARKRGRSVSVYREDGAVVIVNAGDNKRQRK